MTIVWTAAIILFGVVEAVTAGLVSIWFVAGALAALAAAFWGASLGVQLTVFLGVSAAALVLTRPLVRRIISGRAQATNADRVLGGTARATETSDTAWAAGAVSADGKTWTARSADGSVIPQGSQVVVEEIQGVKLVVRQHNQQHSSNKEDRT